MKQETGTFDAAVMVNVLEHIEHDRFALAELARIVRPGGHVLIFVPALSLLMSQLDRDLGHFRRYHRKELRAKMRAAGLRVLTCRYFDLPGAVPWLVINRLLGATSFNPRLVWLYERAIVPVARGVEAVIPPPFGKNLVAIGRVSAVARSAVPIYRSPGWTEDISSRTKHHDTDFRRQACRAMTSHEALPKQFGHSGIYFCGRPAYA